jgi:hypothetical protein
MSLLTLRPAVGAGGDQALVQRLLRGAHVGIWVASVAPICSTAFGSSAPAAKMPRGREYLKLRPMMSTPLASSAAARLSPS